MKHIFLVEDDNAIAKNLTLLLHAEGFRITHAATHRDALAALIENEFDLALIDISLPDVKKDGIEVFLSALEYRLLLVFVSNPSSILTRGRLLDELWDAAGEFVNDNTLTVYIKRLREKIENDPTSPKIILTVRGTGYRLGDKYASQ